MTETQLQYYNRMLKETGEQEYQDMIDLLTK